jgi:uncharacterized membrane protein YphA (DoxX/SURF4 family)
MTKQKMTVATLSRVLLGLVFTVFGLNGFFGFIPQPPHVGPSAEFLGALGATGYMFPLIKGTEVATGLLLLSGRFVPLALTMLAPVVLNIVMFHLFLDPKAIALPIVLMALGIYLAWTERSAYAPLFRARSEGVSRRSSRGHAEATA